MAENFFEQFHKEALVKGGGNFFEQFHREESVGPPPVAPEARFEREPRPATLPEDPFERAALRVRREAATPRPDTPFARAPAATGRFLDETGKTARDLMTGELPPTPENVLPAASMVLTPGARGAAQVARSAAEAAMPRFTQGPVKQAVAERLARVPGVGSPIIKAADEVQGRFVDDVIQAPTRATGTIPDQAVASKHIVDAVKREKALTEPLGALGPSEGAANLPWQFRYILNQEGRAGGGGQNIVGRLVDMASTGKNADVNALGKVRANVAHADWPEVQGAYMQALGRNARGEYDPMLMLDRYANEISTGGRNIMFGDSKAPGGLRHHMDSLVADRARMAAIDRIPERSSHLQKALLAGWALTDPTSALAAVTGGRALAKYLAAPATAAPIAQWSRAYTRMMQAGATPAAIASYNVATRNLENSLGVDGKKITEALRVQAAPQRVGSQEGSMEGPVRATMQLAPEGIPHEKMRQAWENIEDRRAMPSTGEFPGQDETWEDLRARKAKENIMNRYKYYTEFVPSLRPGQFEQEAGLNDLIQQYQVPLPRPRPKKGR